MCKNSNEQTDKSTNQDTKPNAAVCFARLLEKVMSIHLGPSVPPSLGKQQEAERVCRQILDSMTSEEKADYECIAAEILARRELNES